MVRRKEKWFKPGEPLGWRKEEKAATRRRKALASRDGNILATARALQALSNVTKDPATKRLARADARYFFRRYRKGKS
jgi:hypothetical protein